MRLIKWLLVPVVLLVLAVLAVGFFADRFAKAGVEAGGSLALGVDTTLEKARLGFFDQSFSLDGLEVANPPGFGDERFLQLGRGAVEVKLASLFTDAIEVPDITLSRIRLNLIQGAQGSNYGTILGNLERFEGAVEVAGTPQAESVADAKRFVIQKLKLEDVVVSVVAVPELRLAAVTLPLGTIELTDIRSESGEGVVLAELASIVVEAILERASASGQLPALIQGTLKAQLAQLEGLEDAGRRAVENLLDGQGGKAAEGAKKALEEGLKGFGLGR